MKQDDQVGEVRILALPPNIPSFMYVCLRSGVGVVYGKLKAKRGGGASLVVL